MRHVDLLESRQLLSIDLVVTGTLPAGVAGGATVGSAVITNVGRLDVTTPFQVAYYLSTNNRLEPQSDTLINTLQVTALRAGQSTTLNFITASTGVDPGRYFVFFVADPDRSLSESNRSNNAIGSSTPSLMIPEPNAIPWEINTTSSNDSITVESNQSSMTVILNGRSSSRSVLSVTRLVINAGGGDNTIDVSRSPFATALIITGSGRDSITGTNYADNISAGSGNDSVLGQAGNDRIDGQAGNDTLRGGGNDDTLIGGMGTDSLFGDAGNDRLDSRDSTRDVVDGGLGTNRARVDVLDQRKNISQLID